MTPFEFILIFFIGGLMLTGMVGDERSFTNALCQIITVALLHFSIAWGRKRSVKFAKLIDGTPLVLMERTLWRSDVMKRMRVADDDVMAAARDQNLERLEQIDYAVLERNGEISVLRSVDPRTSTYKTGNGEGSRSEKRPVVPTPRELSMPDPGRTRPVQDSVPQVNNEIAVGEDLPFQRRWWRFENGIWVFFTIIVLLDLLGAFGRGYLANASLKSNPSMRVKYERIERVGTPSILAIDFDPQAVRAGKIELLVSDTGVKALGARRIIPEPAISSVGNHEIAYTFAASQARGAVELELRPPSPGVFHLVLRVPGFPPARMRILVMP